MNNRYFIALIGLLMLLSCTETSNPPQKVYYNAFSHNDYHREHPLTDALDCGFNCVEADLWLIDGELFVAHDKEDIRPERTFERMYLEPLSKLITQNKGKVYPQSNRPFMLMVDCKSSGEEMLPVLKQKMEPYRKHFCEVKDGQMHEGAILFFLSGNRPVDTILQAGEGFIFLDGRIKDLGKGIDSNMMPVISDNYDNFLTWKGEGEMPQEQMDKMRSYIRQAHAEGKLFRWWGAPDIPLFKRMFIEEGVDLIGADDLKSMLTVLEQE